MGGLPLNIPYYPLLSPVPLGAAFSLEEFSALMNMLSNLRNANAVVGDEGHQDGCNSAAHELRQRATEFRLQGMDLQTENLACNTKEAYLTHFKLFQVKKRRASSPIQ